jgi:glycosyltransferase involved in cell wall biosynthesis
MKRRIFYLISSFAQGGAERHLLDLVRRLDTDQYELAICVLRREIHYTSDLPAGEPRYVLSGPRFWSPRSRSDLARALRDFRPDIVHCYLNDGNLWGRLAARRLHPPPRVITSVHLDDMALVYRLAERLLHGRSDRIVAHSRSIYDLLVGKLGVPAAKVEVIVNGVDPARFAPATPERRAAARRTWQLAPEAFVCLMPARIAEQKNQDLVVAAVTALKAGGKLPAAFRLLLAGRVSSPALSRRLDGLIAGGGLASEVQRLGAVKDIESLYAASDVVLMPSRTEASPIAALESLAAGVPVLISDTANTDAVIVPGQHGWQVVANDPAALEASLVEILASSGDERRRRGLAGRAHVEARFTHDRVAADFSRLYAELVPPQREGALASSAS